VAARHLRPLLGFPGTALGVVSWPSTAGHRAALRWHFWWQAHLLDCALDAWQRSPNTERAVRVRRLIRTIELRNFGRFTNDYYDDIAWMGLALQRAERLTGRQPAVGRIATRILDAWEAPKGGIPWRVGAEFYNAPANGPAAILLARTGFTRRAQQMADWMDAALRLPGSDLIADGLVPGEPLQPTYYSYCQGVVLGTELELVRRGAPAARLHRLLAAVDAELTDGGVLRGHGGGNGGLFTGILARYLALIATDLPGDAPPDVAARAVARRLVLDSAEAAWTSAVVAPGGPLFSPEWSVPAVLPTGGVVGRTSGARVDESAQPERDLSVQLSGWMLLEAAARLA
jgi:predicted alpha-1,6-mannanase (GH76 family)